MNSKIPVYQKIATIIKARISAGHYKPGEKIPPIRRFTELFGVNKSTVLKAFERLKHEGVIENRVGSGSYVRYPERIIGSGGLFDYRTDYLHEQFFAHQQVRHFFNNLFEKEKADALAPTPAEGEPELLRVLGQQYHLPADRMLIISGAQQGLDLVSKVFSAKISDSILFEDPTYPGAISLFKARHFVAMDSDGPQLDILDQRLQGRIRLFYSMPSVHNPTGISYSAAKMEAVARRARRCSFFIIEDDYLGELKPGARRFVDMVPERTIHIKSFAQTTLAGLRLGLMVVPDGFFDRFVYAKYTSDITSFGLLQRFLREFIKHGLYNQHLASVRIQADIRRDRLQALLNQYPSLSVGSNQSGYSVWVKPSRSLHSPHVPWCRGEEFSFSPSIKPFFRLSFMHMADTVFEQSLPYLENLIAKSLDPATSEVGSR